MKWQWESEMLSSAFSLLSALFRIIKGRVAHVFFVNVILYQKHILNKTPIFLNFSFVFLCFLFVCFVKISKLKDSTLLKMYTYSENISKYYC